MSLSDGLHRASVVASSEGKTLFSIPITVAKPSTLEAPVISYSSRFKPGTIVRRFIQVPLGATWVDVRVKASNRSVAAQVWMHCVQLYPLKRLSKTEDMFIWSLMPGEPETRKRIKVSGGVPLEICTTQAWNSSGETDIEIVCDFHGLSLVNGNDTLSITGGAGVSSFDVFSSLRTETFSPSVIFSQFEGFIYVLGISSSNAGRLSTEPTAADKIWHQSHVVTQQTCE